MNEQLKNYINMVDGCMDSTLVEPEDNAAWLIVKHTLEESIDAALASPADALVAGDRVDLENWNTQMAGVKALLECTEGELECIDGKLLKDYVEHVKRIYAAIRAQKDGHG